VKFELFVANRYLRARRKEAVISVITAISVVGVAVGVMALVISLGVNNGFRDTLQRNLLGATAHVNVEAKASGEGIANWRELVEKFRHIPHVTGVAPVLYGPVFLTGPASSKGVVLKGIFPDIELQTSDTLKQLKAGSLDRLNQDERPPGIIVGSRLAEETGLMLNNQVTVMSPQGIMSPLGMGPGSFRFRVVGIFESGFYDLDDNWTYASMPTVQRTFSLRDVVNSIELRLDDIYLAHQVADQAEKLAGPEFASTTWEEQNRQILKALNMERVITIITIGLIELIAALNIFITLVMMVMEKYRDIAILISMGARRAQIRRIFIAQGLLIGCVGTVIGLVIGYAFCYFADHYRWIQLDAQVYALSFVPFEPRWVDGVWVAAVAIFVSFCATLYPARNATRIAPVEVLRYE
jgi:lipoprotein-releasing system permease protein